MYFFSFFRCTYNKWTFSISKASKQLQKILFIFIAVILAALLEVGGKAKASATLFLYIKITFFFNIKSSIGYINTATPTTVMVW